ncbi:peptide-methionine (S)-S-oxide reductase MsrA [Pseudaestuariivita sp.]|uniref:peptide-methionine (S)-S-oxide reductase MsrA n=1 Tax=Pseudaestuariivita sp. TaxID=2211669 RepID=UPI0040599675
MFKIKVLAVLVAVGLIANAKTAAAQTETLTVAGGCFWCVEKDFERVPGVIEAVSGYTGGSVDNPTYKQVTSGRTGHYEAVQITYDASRVSVDTLLSLFFRSVDPTDAGGQFCDRGDSYRTAIFATSGQEAAAQRAKADAQAELGQSIVTPILPKTQFFEAEAYHQDYYKSDERILTRFGLKTKADAYKRYRAACGRDAKVKELWGSDAPFIN